MQTYKVPDMSCAHCVATIETTIRTLDPQAVVRCNVESKEVTVATEVAADRIVAALAEAGYPSQPLAV